MRAVPAAGVLALLLAAAAGAAPGGLDRAEIERDRQAGLALLREANQLAEAWRLAGGEEIRARADGKYRLAAEGHERIWTAVRDAVAAGDPGRGGERTLEMVRREAALRQLELNLAFERAQIEILGGCLWPDDDPARERGNARVEAGNAILNDLRGRVATATGVSKERVVDVLIPPSFYLLKAFVMEHRGDREKALANYRHAVAGAGTVAAMEVVRIQALLRTADLLRAWSMDDARMVRDALEVANALEGAARSPGLQRRAALFRAEILLSFGRRAEAIELAAPLAEGRAAPAPVAVEADVRRWIAALDDDDYSVREEASQRIAEAGAAALPIVREALSGECAPEMRARLEVALGALEDAGSLAALARDDPGAAEIVRLHARRVLAAAGAPYDPPGATEGSAR